MKLSPTYFLFPLLLALAVSSLSAAPDAKKSRPIRDDLTNPPLAPADISTFPGKTDHLDVFLLITS